MRTIQEVEERAGQDLSVTQQEAEALVRSITRTCRGNPILTTNQMQTLATAWHQHRQANDWEAAKTATLDAETLIGVEGGPVEDNYDWEALWVRAARAIFAHGDTVGKPCGQDYNDLICALPFDGKSHVTTCPKCGATNHVRTPRFVIEAAAN